MDAQRRQALLKEYGEVNSNFRTLTDIRFRLLGLLPLATAVTAALGTRNTAGDGIGIPIAMALLGLAAATGIVTYNARNDQLYNELVGRAAAIERSVGLLLPDGAFSNRPRAWLYFKLGPWVWHVSHGQGVATIYAATIAFWLYLTFDALIHTVAPKVSSSVVLVLALVGTALGVAIVWTVMQHQQRTRSHELRSNVLAAMRLLTNYGNDLALLKKDPCFLQACAAALGGSIATVAARAEFYGGLTPESMNYYATTGSIQHKSASLVSLLTDLPQIWVFDLAMNRREITPGSARCPHSTPAPIPATRPW